MHTHRHLGHRRRRGALPVVLSCCRGAVKRGLPPLRLRRPHQHRQRQRETTRPSVAPAPADPVWHYEGAEGPRNWGKLSPKFAACGEGRAQSPIDIANPASRRDAES